MAEVSFNVEGEFITNLARSQFYEEKRPFEKVKNLLLSCMSGTSIPLETLEKYVDDILTFKRKFTGNTKDENFCLVEDTRDNLPYYIKNKNIEDYYTKLKQGKSEFEISQYGFIDTKGKFIPVPWCEHSSWARKYLEENYSIDELVKTSQNGKYVNADYLIYIKGWILLHNAHQGEAFAEQGKPMTKAQRETLYDYYMNYNRISEANKLFEEEN